MPLRFGLASSHNVYLVIPAENWEAQYQKVASHVPAPNEAKAETLDVIRGYIERINGAIKTLRTQLAEYKPDALIVVSDDQGELFDPSSSMSSMALYLGDEVSGKDGTASRLMGKEVLEDAVRMPGHPELADFLARGLVEREFDVTCIRQIEAGRRLGHGFIRMTPRLVPSLNVPVIPLLLNCYYPPLPSATRCLKLGQALAELLEQRPERVAIYGSGGLSHDPGGPRAGWIDQPLDRFVLDALASGKADRLHGLYMVDSDTMRGGTGEIRNWLVVAGAMANRKASIVDYIPAYHAVTGLGFAYWPTG